jgi:hypothetical protein
MNDLRLCKCGHPLGHHNDDGCHGGDGRRCACTRDRMQALDYAFNLARNYKVRLPRSARNTYQRTTMASNVPKP